MAEDADNCLAEVVAMKSARHGLTSKNVRSIFHHVFAAPEMQAFMTSNSTSPEWPVTRKRAKEEGLEMSPVKRTRVLTLADVLSNELSESDDDEYLPPKEDVDEEEYESECVPSPSSTVTSLLSPRSETPLIAPICSRTRSQLPLVDVDLDQLDGDLPEDEPLVEEGRDPDDDYLADVTGFGNLDDDYLAFKYQTLGHDSVRSPLHELFVSTMSTPCSAEEDDPDYNPLTDVEQQRADEAADSWYPAARVSGKELRLLQKDATEEKVALLFEPELRSLLRPKKRAVSPAREANYSPMRTPLGKLDEIAESADTDPLIAGDLHRPQGKEELERSRNSAIDELRSCIAAATRDLMPAFSRSQPPFPVLKAERLVKCEPHKAPEEREDANVFVPDKEEAALIMVQLAQHTQLLLQTMALSCCSADLSRCRYEVVSLVSDIASLSQDRGVFSTAGCGEVLTGIDALMMLTPSDEVAESAIPVAPEVQQILLCSPSLRFPSLLLRTMHVPRVPRIAFSPAEDILHAFALKSIDPLPSKLLRFRSRFVSQLTLPAWTSRAISFRYRNIQHPRRSPGHTLKVYKNTGVVPKVQLPSPLLPPPLSSFRDRVFPEELPEYLQEALKIRVAPRQLERPFGSGTAQLRLRSKPATVEFTSAPTISGCGGASAAPSSLVTAPLSRPGQLSRPKSILSAAVPPVVTSPAPLRSAGTASNTPEGTSSRRISSKVSTSLCEPAVTSAKHTPVISRTQKGSSPRPLTTLREAPAQSARPCLAAPIQGKSSSSTPVLPGSFHSTPVPVGAFNSAQSPNCAATPTVLTLRLPPGSVNSAETTTITVVISSSAATPMSRSHHSPETPQLNVTQSNNSSPHLRPTLLSIGNSGVRSSIAKKEQQITS